MPSPSSFSKRPANRPKVPVKAQPVIAREKKLPRVGAIAKLWSYLGLWITVLFFGFGVVAAAGGVVAFPPTPPGGRQGMAQLKDGFTELSRRDSDVRQAEQESEKRVEKILESHQKNLESIQQEVKKIGEKAERIFSELQNYPQALPRVQDELTQLRHQLERLPSQLEALRMHTEGVAKEEQPGPAGTLIFWIVHSDTSPVMEYWEPIKSLLPGLSSLQIVFVCYAQEQDKVVTIYDSRGGQSNQLRTPATQATRTVNWPLLANQIEKLSQVDEWVQIDQTRAAYPRPWRLFIVAPAVGLMAWNYGSPISAQEMTVHSDDVSSSEVPPVHQGDTEDYIERIRWCVDTIFVFLTDPSGRKLDGVENLYDLRLNWKFVRFAREESGSRERYQDAVREVLAVFLGMKGS